MGLLEGVKKQYYLYTDDGDKVLQVIPLNPNVNHVISYGGKYIFGKSFTNMSDADLKAIINKFGLKYVHELDNQIDIYSFLED